MADVLAVREEYRMENWKQLIAERARSQMTIRAFCSEHGISTRSYYYWLRKIRQEAAEQVPTFVELSRKNHRTDKPMLCIRYGTATLELPGDVNMEAVTALLQSLQSHD